MKICNIIISLLLLSSCGGTESSNSIMDCNSHKNKAQYNFILDIEGSACDFEVGINDYRLLDNGDRGSSIWTEVGANQWIFCGTNNLNLSIRPHKNKYLSSSELIVKLIRRISDGSEKEVVLAEYKSLSLIELGNVSISENVSFEINALPFSPHLFQNSKVINTSDSAIMEKAIKKYKELYTLLEQKDIDKLMQEYELRQIDLAKSLYVDPDLMIRNLRASLEDDFSNPNNVLVLFKPENLRPSLYCGGNVIELTYYDANLQPLTFWDTEARMRSVYETHLCLDENDNFFICR